MCDALFVRSDGLYEVFLLERSTATVAAYHLVASEKLWRQFPRLRESIDRSERFLLRAEELFADQKAASAAQWSKVLETLKEPLKTSKELIDQRLEALWQRLLRLARQPSSQEATLAVVETCNLLDSLGLNRSRLGAPVRQSLKELTDDVKRGHAVKGAVQVLAGLLQFISATAPGTSHTTRSSSAPQCDDDGDVVAAWEAASAVQEDTPTTPSTAASSPPLPTPLPMKSSQVGSKRAGVCAARGMSKKDAPAAVESVSAAPEARHRCRSAGSASVAPKARRWSEPWDGIGAESGSGDHGASEDSDGDSDGQAEEATQELQLRLHQGQLVALKTAELFRERDAQRAHRQERSAQRSRQGSLQRSEGSCRGRSVSPDLTPRFLVPAPEPCPRRSDSEG
eukprot:g31554.t1